MLLHAGHRDAGPQLGAGLLGAASGATRPSSAEELTRLSELRSRGDITDEEFNRAKALILTDDRPAASPAPGMPPTPGR
ncbi:SHOCT domain-containing protein [Streptomyces massasporeus]